MTSELLGNMFLWVGGLWVILLAVMLSLFMVAAILDMWFWIKNKLSEDGKNDN